MTQKQDFIRVFRGLLLLNIYQSISMYMYISSVF